MTNVREVVLIPVCYFFILIAIDLLKEMEDAKRSMSGNIFDGWNMHNSGIVLNGIWNQAVLNADFQKGIQLDDVLKTILTRESSKNSNAFLALFAASHAIVAPIQHSIGHSLAFPEDCL
jgi:hypothetical protein